MNRILLFLLPLICSFCYAQNYTYIGVENGLSNRRVYSIQKDRQGYMWFLTHNGIDRFDGKNFKHYPLELKNEEINSFINLNHLHTDTLGNIWEISRRGQVYRYNRLTDQFEFIKAFKTDPTDKDRYFCHAYIDNKNNIWLCTSEKQYIYNIDKDSFTIIKSNINEDVSNIVQLDTDHYCFGTYKGIHLGLLNNNTFKTIKDISIDTLSIQVNALFYSKKQNKIIIGCFLNGLYIYDFTNNKIKHLNDLDDININCIKELNDKEVLIGTDGAGVYKMDITTDKLIPYIVADYNQANKMNGNNINDIYIDGNKRIWMANYPIGITVLNLHFPKFKWFKHAIGNKNSLINDQVNAIIEDSDGDLWFATNNGISCYNERTNTWTNILSSFHNDAHNKNHIFISLCEIEPGVIIAGGYNSGMYYINKRTMKATYFIPKTLGAESNADKYIRSIQKDSQGRTWIGGFYYLKYIDFKNRKIEFYKGIKHVNYILEEDPNHLWIGNSEGLYLLDVNTKKFHHIDLPIEVFYVNVIHKEKDGTLYIGTGGSGLIVYNPKTKKATNYNKWNSALISNSIYTILPDGNGQLILSTENSLSRFNLKKRVFHNWTKEQGLTTTHFNRLSGTLTKRNTVVVGTGDGAIEFNKNANLPNYDDSKLVFSEFSLFYQAVHPGGKDSPLTNDINETAEIHLNHNQNIFSLRLSTINYDYPSKAIYSWKLDGFYNEWNKPSAENTIRYTNLSPGKYKLYVRTISNEDYHVIEERTMNIIISPPFWATIWAIVFYCAIILIIAGALLRYYLMKKDKENSGEKISFFLNAAHDLRTPLTLIQAPLNDILEQESLSKNGEANLLTALRSANALFKLVNNLINFEKTMDSSVKLNIAEYELYSYIQETLQLFKPYSEAKQIQLTFESNFRFLNVWFDREKMDSIIRNLISNALKYTPERGSVTIIAFSNPSYWSVEIRDTGIGIPVKEQKKLFHMFFRGSNTVNLKATGSGIGLLLAKKLVKKHKGRIYVKTKENEGSSFTVKFKHGHQHFNTEQLGMPVETTEESTDKKLFNIPENNNLTKDPSGTINSNLPKILVVEDNDDLIDYLRRSFSDKYLVFTANDGKEGLEKAKIIMPQLIISDIMMPIMRGDEMCRLLKNDIETSHIPIILLSALGDRENILKGLQTKADKYVTKPFDIAIFKADVESILANRAILAEQYAKLEIPKPSNENYVSELDYEFMCKVKKAIESNIDNTNYNVDILCSELNMSRSSFYNKIKILTDQSPADFIRVYRLNKSKELLSTKKYTINDVTYMVGFNDPKYFREVFKKYFDMTPSQFIASLETDNK